MERLGDFYTYLIPLFCLSYTIELYPHRLNLLRKIPWFIIALLPYSLTAKVRHLFIFLKKKGRPVLRASPFFLSCLLLSSFLCRVPRCPCLRCLRFQRRGPVFPPTWGWCPRPRPGRRRGPLLSGRS